MTPELAEVKARESIFVQFGVLFLGVNIFHPRSKITSDPLGLVLLILVLQKDEFDVVPDNRLVNHHQLGEERMI